MWAVVKNEKGEIPAVFVVLLVVALIIGIIAAFAVGLGRIYSESASKSPYDEKVKLQGGRDEGPRMGGNLIAEKPIAGHREQTPERADSNKTVDERLNEIQERLKNSSHTH